MWHLRETECPLVSFGLSFREEAERTERDGIWMEADVKSQEINFMSPQVKVLGADFAVVVVGDVSHSLNPFWWESEPGKVGRIPVS